MLKSALRIIGAALPRLSLSHCLLCNDPRQVEYGLCRPCQRELPLLGPACRLCALPLASSDARLCPRCLQQPPPFASSHVQWIYAYPVAQLIQRFKYQRDLSAGRTLAELAASGLQPPQDRPDVLIAVPLHWRRQWSRGYNQAQLIAQEFARQWHIASDPRLLRKTLPSDSQQQLNRQQRLQNLRNSFTAATQVQGLHVGLVDDVITTGATLEAAAGTLLAAGARLVSTYALARTP